MQHVNKWSERSALRCLALAYKLADDQQASVTASDECDFVFLGIVGLHDPPRLEVMSSIHTCVTAGIRVIMITGAFQAMAFFNRYIG